MKKLRPRCEKIETLKNASPNFWRKRESEEHIMANQNPYIVIEQKDENKKQ